TADSGAPKWWAASDTRAGVFWLPDLSIDTADFVSQQIRSVRQNEDLVIFSIHWGENWGYEIPADQHSFAHRLIERGAPDGIYGHSSHHPKGIEVCRNKLVLYGCGDFLNDYEGIAGYERFHSDIVLMYFVTLDCSTGDLMRLELVPLKTRRFRLELAHDSEAE